MRSPYGMELVEDCLSCKLCAEGFFCHLPKSVMEAFQPLKFTGWRNPVRGRTSVPRHLHSL
jgi:hypothetical protein